MAPQRQPAKEGPNRNKPQSQENMIDVTLTENNTAAGAIAAAVVAAAADSDTGTGAESANPSSIDAVDINFDPLFMDKVAPLVIPEFRAAIVWALLSCALRLGLWFLSSLAAHRSTEMASRTSLTTTVLGHGLDYSNTNNNNTTTTNPDLSDGTSSEFFLERTISETLMALSVFSGWMLSLLPSGLPKGEAPGFVFASAWLLLPIRSRFGVIPNIPARICEMVLGRLTPRELVVILPIHFLGAIFGAFIFRVLLPTFLEQRAIDPIVYSEGNPWLVDFIRETVVNAAFTISILVIPELLKVNQISLIWTPLFMYPLYSYSVDAAGMASAFAPNFIYALRCVSKHEEVPLGQSSHMLGPIAGGWIAGKIMSNFFPDEHDISNS